MKNLLDEDEELLANMPTQTDQSSSSEMIIPSASWSPRHLSNISWSPMDIDPSQIDNTMVYDCKKKDWTHKQTSIGDMDQTNLPNIEENYENDETNVEDFLRILEEEASTSTQRKQCEFCHTYLTIPDNHECEPCPCCKERICICGYPPELCFICNKIIGSGCTCPFETQ